MEGILSIGGFFLVVGFLFWSLTQSLLRWREISRDGQVMSQLAAQVRGGEEAATFLESASVRALFDNMIDRRTLLLQRVLRAVQSGIILVLLGIALFAIRTQLTDEDSLVAANVFATISVALGAAFLIAGGVSYALSSRWGLLKETE